MVNAFRLLQVILVIAITSCYFLQLGDFDHCDFISSFSLVWWFWSLRPRSVLSFSFRQFSSLWSCPILPSILGDFNHRDHIVFLSSILGDFGYQEHVSSFLVFWSSQLHPIFSYVLGDFGHCNNIPSFSSIFKSFQSLWLYSFHFLQFGDVGHCDCIPSFSFCIRSHSFLLVWRFR